MPISPKLIAKFPQNWFKVQNSCTFFKEQKPRSRFQLRDAQILLTERSALLRPGYLGSFKVMPRRT